MQRFRTIIIGLVIITSFTFYYLFHLFASLKIPDFNRLENKKIIFDWIAQRNIYQKLILSSDTKPRLIPRKLCQDNPFFIIIVCSSLDNFIPRRIIRNTWIQDAKKLKNVNAYFLVGTTFNYNNSIALDEESEKYEDIIQYDFLDSYYNLTLKSVLLLKWINNYCQNVSYVMKIDDDVFLQVSNLVDYLSNIRNYNLLMGFKVHSAAPVQNINSKWFMPLAGYSKSVYPDYLAGPGYVMGRNAINILYQNSFLEPFIHIEDVYITGMCSEKSKLYLNGSDLFHYYKSKNDPCRFHQMFAIHKMSPDELYQLHKAYSLDLLCN